MSISSRFRRPLRQAGLLSLAVALLMAPADAAVYQKGDRLRPRPTVVTPPTASTQDEPGRPPGDAILLFDGQDLLAHWMEFNPKDNRPDPSRPPKWIVKDGYTEAFGNQIQTRASFADCHLHIEWMTSPEEARQAGRIDQKRGNSGIEFGPHPEIQIHDSYENDTYPDGQAAAIYGLLPPRVNASRPPGQWQSYDIYYTAPRFAEGRKVSPATYTVLHNGLPVHLATEIPGDEVECRIRIRPHGSPVRFRNIWVRPLHDYDENAGQPLPVGARTTNPFKSN
jgi:hypothetical protein